MARSNAEFWGSYIHHAVLMNFDNYRLACFAQIRSPGNDGLNAWGAAIVRHQTKASLARRLASLAGDRAGNALDANCRHFKIQ
jgi:hypothetical protein